MTEEISETELEAYRKEIGKKGMYEIKNLLASGVRGEKYKILMQEYIRSKQQHRY